MPEGGLDNPSDCDPTASPLISTIYKVEVEDPATGCRGSGQSEICVVSGICGEPLIFVPNAFTPNGDGLNDVLYVRGYNIERVILFAIYNRWGEKVFESHSVNEGWDGDYKGRTAKGDVFAYYLKVECQTGEEFFKKGNVTVIR
jgi:gliding motility-associated-like protein